MKIFIAEPHNNERAIAIPIIDFQVGEIFSNTDLSLVVWRFTNVNGGSILVWSLMWRLFSPILSHFSRNLFFLIPFAVWVTWQLDEWYYYYYLVLQVFRISVFFCLWSFLKWCKLDNFVLLYTSRKWGLSAFPNLYDIFCCIFLSN